jgi:uncharacterized RDD family membrane protein YckC
MNSDVTATAIPSDLKFAPIDSNKLPSLVLRVMAIFFDLVIMLIVFSLASVLIDMVNDVPVFIKGSLAVTMFILYDPLLTAFSGGTLGHKIMGLTVKQFDSPHQNISVVSAFLRFAVKGTLGWLSFLTVTSSKNKRAIHDTLSGSIVLR